jgi:2-polyprenyl-3-methyl-5-hydroxy-6-metoxy-1,4-benzoquinol methylase
MKTREPQYSSLFDVENKYGRTTLGLMTNQSWNEDPRRFVFTLARYKFVSKIMAGLDNVIEVGCADAFGSRLVRQEVKNLTVTDFDPTFVEDVKSRLTEHWSMNVTEHDFVKAAYPEKFSGLFALDVLEHISPNDEASFIMNCCKSLKPNGILIFGMPSLESQVYASEASKLGHVNCKSGDEFRATMKNYFENVLLFSMNDEVVHTGFTRMAHYLITVCLGSKVNA